MAGVQKVRLDEPPPRQTTAGETREIVPVQTDEAPPVKQLDGEVVRLGRTAFARGMYYEVWEGRWEKGGGKKGGGEEVGKEGEEVEKVSWGLTTPILLIWVSEGGLESA